MRVLHLPKWYPNRYDDQDGDFVARHVAAIAGSAPLEQPLQSAVVFAAVARGPLKKLIEEEVDLGGPVPVWRYYYRAQPTGFAPLDKLLKLALYFWSQHRGYRRVCQHWGQRPDLVHVHVLLRTGLWALWLRQRHRIPYLVTEHWTRYLPGRGGRISGVRRYLSRLVVRRAAAVHTVSENLRQALGALDIAHRRTFIIPNVVDTDLFRLPAEPAQRRGLLNVAAFNEQAKNLSGTLRTVARLRTEHPALGLHLRIAGYGPAEAAMHQLAAELGLLADGTVEFLGKLTSEQVAEEMRQAQAFVLFSNYENLPCVLIEAQASGLPAVATRVNGVPELLPPDGSAGLLVEPGNEAALYDALLAVLRAPAGRFDEHLLREGAVARFSYPAVGAAFRHVYRQMLGA
ncbi:glycosyltransferase [Hymenobacter rubripertinctus]|uniref:Glycosyltransferase family 4 protein n=1 Tax=Hymenobacter rubripertinctus TaxID=2029981 RepID=A0A418QUT7_9BACT|nr:glycosyltransferase [Hymenobacter rubripertinctus]RIY08893.1 glycosyltransferase family 4 protein [Hymenobacter rubripertinctus]